MNERCKMADPKLVDYIKISLSRKIPIEQTKKALLAKGWNEADVTAAINQATQKQPVNPMPKKVIRPLQKPMPSISKPISIPKIQPKPMVQRQPPILPPKIQQPQPEVKPMREPLKVPTEPFRPQQKKPEKKGMKIKLSKNLIFILIGAGFLVLLIVLLIVFRGSSSISADKLAQGASVSLKQTKDVKFTVNNLEHTLTVNSISGSSVSITILSTPMTTTLNTGETKKFDFETDGIYDLSVRLVGIESGKADLYIQKISEECVEEWDCTDWGDCIEGNQTRVCTDLTKCGTQKNKPAERQECEVIVSCEEQNGSICTENQLCNGEITNSTDGDCCVGECEDIEPTNCGSSISCFMDNAENCTIASLTFESDVGNETWDETVEYYFEIKGLSGNDTCEVYNNLTDASGSFTQDGVNALTEEGKNETEIDQLEEDLNDAINSMIGDDGTCNYPISNLIEVLEAMRDDGLFDLSSSNTDEYCTGDLFS